MMEVLDHTVHTLTVETLQDGECVAYYCVHTCTVTVLSLSVPGPVSDLTAIPGIVHIDVSWSPTLERNGVISNYEVCFTIDSAVMNCTNTSATQNTLRLRDLPPNTVVTLSVRAYTIIGPGAAVSRNVSTKHVRK